MQAENIKILSFGCRLNALEAEKIQNMLRPYLGAGIIVNTCAVTAEAERQSGQAVRKVARENPEVPIFVTGCAATRNPELFANIKNVFVVHNAQKMDLDAYLGRLNAEIIKPQQTMAEIKTKDNNNKLSKQFIQIQNGCNHKCAYCITRALRGTSVSFDYIEILKDVQNAVCNGFHEIVLTGIDIASYVKQENNKTYLISDLCKRLLDDVPGIQRLRLSSVDPAVPDIDNVIDLILRDERMMPHLHFSMQSGSDAILRAMGRRHSAQRVRDLVQRGGGKITFSWDIICGFPGETDELFRETMDLVHEVKPIKIHAFPFSPRPGTPAADMSGQINRAISKERVRKITELASKNRTEFMQAQIGKTVQVLVEENNVARCPHDISVKIDGRTLPERTICNVQLTDVQDDCFIGKNN